MIVESDAAHAVVWTKPDDWQPDPQQPLFTLGMARPGGFNAVFMDGSVHFLAQSIDIETLRALLTIDGGERVAVPGP